jgi:hypothetical protein
MNTEIVKCPIRGCRKKLGSNNIPLEYCDFQQGRCPMYPKTDFTFIAVLVYILIFVLLFGVIWATI